MGKRTVLHPCHVQLGARMVDFAGWEMPVQYAGILGEHAACRERVAAFDISHMGEIEVQAPDVRAALDAVLSNDLSGARDGAVRSGHRRCPDGAARSGHGRCPDGAARYGFILNDDGGIIDDVIAFVRDSSRAMVVTNAANTGRDFAWIADHVPGGCEVRDVSDSLAKIDVQGPRSREVVSRVFGRDLGGLKYFRFLETPWNGAQVALSRTGYTGKLGYEVFAGPERAVDLWEAILEAGAAPAGLGARDTLRLEAGLPLYGHEFDEGTSPLEAGFMRYVALDKAADFPGKEALGPAAALPDGPAHRLVGLEMVGRGVPRAGYAVEDGGAVAGSVTSGTVSPTLGKGIAMAYVEAGLAAPGRRLDVVIRERRVPCAVVEMPFYRGTART